MRTRPKKATSSPPKPIGRNWSRSRGLRGSAVLAVLRANAATGANRVRLVLVATRGRPAGKAIEARKERAVPRARVAFQG